MFTNLISTKNGGMLAEYENKNAGSFLRKTIFCFLNIYVLIMFMFSCKSISRCWSYVRTWKEQAALSEGLREARMWSLIFAYKAQLQDNSLAFNVICAASISRICCFLQTKHKLTSTWQQTQSYYFNTIFSVFYLVKKIFITWFWNIH